MRYSRPRAYLAIIAIATAIVGCDGQDRGQNGSSPTPPVGDASPVPPTPARFADRSRESGIVVASLCGGEAKDYILEVNGAGVCWIDYDLDGVLDLYVVDGSTVERVSAGLPGEPNRLYRGAGDGTFSLVEGAGGADDRGWGYGCSVADYDNDGRPDLFVTNYGANRLYRNQGDGTFADVTMAAGIRGDGWSTAVSFSDFDGDGLLDLFVGNYLAFDADDPPVDGKVIGGIELSCKWAGDPVMCGPLGLVPEADQLYMNAGDGTFVDASTSSGIAASEASFGFVAVAVDFDDDGDLDIYVANDSVANFLWDNDGNGHFVDIALRAGVAVAESGSVQASMGLDAQDYDGDGLIDIVFTNFAKEYNSLLRNLGGGMFIDVSYVAGLATATLPRLAWAVSFGDFDLDRDLDLFIVNGHVYPGAEEKGEGGWRQRNQLFFNEKGKFVDVSDESGPVFHVRRVGRAAAFADYDRDGDLDLMVTNLDEPPTLLENLVTGRHWLELDLVGVRSSRDGFGARVTVTLPDGVTMVRDLHSGASYLSSSSKTVHFGLGDSAVVSEIRIRWLSGAETLLSDVHGDQLLTIREDGGLAVTVLDQIGS